MIDYGMCTRVTRSGTVITIISKTNSNSIALLRKTKNPEKKRQFTTFDFLEFFSMYPLKSISNYSKSNDMMEK